MIQNDGASYQEAYTQAEKLKKLLQSKTNIDIVDLQMDADAFKKNKIRVTLSVGQWYLPSLASIHWDQDKTKYQIQKTATTEFISSNSYGTGATAQGTAIVQFALQWVGNPYVWGGNSLTNGIDCSHFVWQCLTHCGVYNGPYAPSGEWRSLGQPVADLAHAKAGDVLCYAGHVAIYDGNGMIVEAKNETAGITHDRSADCRPILAIRRFTTD